MALARAVRTVKSVLFVCTGNICRSPIAEGLFRRLIGNRGDIDVVSAGVHAVRGQPPSLYAVQVCAEDGTDISDVRSQPLTAALVDHATHIFAMTGAHLETIQTLFPQGGEKSFLLREFEEPGTTVWRDVPDPIGLGREVYEDCARIIKNALPSVLAFVEQSALVPPGAARTGSAYPGDDIAYPMEPQKSTSSPRIYGEALRRTDPEIFDAIVAEEKRQRENIELIASENFTSRAVMEPQGSVLTNCHPANFSGKFYGVSQYGVSEKTEKIDYDALQKQAEEVRPVMITAGASAYPRIIDFPRLRQIADSVGAILFIDMAHIAGLVAGGQHPSPIPHAQFVTTTTHKSLRGPRGGIVMCQEQFAKQIDATVFPGVQGGPL